MMKYALVLNRFSITPNQDIYEAGERLRNFLYLYHAINQTSFSKGTILPFSFDFNGIELINGYTIYQWRRDIRATNRDLHQLYLSFLNRSYNNIYIDDEEQSFQYGNYECNILLKAYLDRNLVMSFFTPEFASTCFEGKYTYILDDCIESIDVNLPNVSQVEHLSQGEISAFLTAERDRQLHDMVDGETFWNKKEELFPTLEFCESVKDQINRVDNDFLLNSIYKLEVLERFFSNWDWGEFDYHQVCGVSPESESALQRFARDHTFVIPNGETVMVTYHIKGASFHNRSYFYINYRDKKITICSMCNHLRTDRYPNP